MKLRSWNVNGLRSVHGKGFLDWFRRENADFVALQEIKATPDQLDPSVRWIEGYKAYFHPAEKLGYSGVAVYSKVEPKEIRYGLGDHFADTEGRVLQLDFGTWTLINAYFPNSQREHARLGFKLEFCSAMHRVCQDLRAQKKTVVLCGDYNIAHQEMDLRNPKENQKNAGFLPEERAWMGSFLESGFVDPFRMTHPGEGGHYTWWSYRPGIRERNIGWRIDYFCVDQESSNRVQESFHQPETTGSDHCPVGLEIDL